MEISCSIPSSLQKYTDNNKQVNITALNIKDMIKEINNIYPGFEKQILNDDKSIKRFLNIYINDEDVRFLDYENSLLKNGDKVIILTAVAGGWFFLWELIQGQY